MDVFTFHGSFSMWKDVAGIAEDLVVVGEGELRGGKRAKERGLSGSGSGGSGGVSSRLSPGVRRNRDKAEALLAGNQGYLLHYHFNCFLGESVFTFVVPSMAYGEASPVERRWKALQAKIIKPCGKLVQIGTNGGAVTLDPHPCELCGNVSNF
ncbi:hypothetical protein F2Q69_00031217 [Brassica cretica]|uniref:Uncharacterized protein n=1 Tax=Brassica cretica TaxID=69181 RepID=A0A8S9RWP8_BRACR|nr:hypothetical protein F2Q69_00031217 [Brassica cretica]